MNLSKLCFGCEALGGTDWGDYSLNEIEYAIKESLNLGINFFDTAGVYGLGLSEKRLSKILGNKRKDVVIATKGGLSWVNKNDNIRSKVFKNSSRKALKEDVIKSLKRLDLDYLPIFYIHWPDLNTPFYESFDQLESMKKDGLIKYIGCSNFTLSQLQEITKFSTIEYLQIPLNIINLESQREIMNFCQSMNIKVIAYNVLFSGLLSGKYNKNSTFESNDRRSRLKEFSKEKLEKNLADIQIHQVKAKKLNISLLQYSIKKILEEKCVQSTITGIKNISQLKENYEATI